MSDEEELGKSGPARRTEAFYRRNLRESAQTYQDQSLRLRGETVGIACKLTGLADAVAAIEELVNEALARWARLQALEHLSSEPESPSDSPDAEDLRKANITDSGPDAKGEGDQFGSDDGSDETPV